MGGVGAEWRVQRRSRYRCELHSSNHRLGWDVVRGQRATKCGWTGCLQLEEVRL